MPNFECLLRPSRSRWPSRASRPCRSVPQGRRLAQGNRDGDVLPAVSGHGDPAQRQRPTAPLGGPSHGSASGDDSHGTESNLGPLRPGGNDPLTYRLVVTQLGNAVFAYTLSARAPSIGASESEFLTVLEGAVTQGLTVGNGKGRMTVHFDNRRKVSPQSCEQGRIDFDFDSLGDPALLDITSAKRAVRTHKTAAANRSPLGMDDSTPSTAKAAAAASYSTSAPMSIKATRAVRYSKRCCFTIAGMKMARVARTARSPMARSPAICAMQGLANAM